MGLCLEDKRPVLESFKEFHALVERQTSEKLKCVRSDNAREYCGPFDFYCKQHGILYEKAPPKTPSIEWFSKDDESNTN